MMHKTGTRYDTVRLLRECLRLVECERPCELSIQVDEFGTGKFSIVITGRAHTNEGANPDDVDTVVIRKRDDTTEEVE